MVDIGEGCHLCYMTPVGDDSREATSKDVAILKRKYLALEMPEEEW